MPPERLEVDGPTQRTGALDRRMSPAAHTCACRSLRGPELVFASLPLDYGRSPPPRSPCLPDDGKPWPGSRSPRPRASRRLYRRNCTTSASSARKARACRGRDPSPRPAPRAPFDTSPRTNPDIRLLHRPSGYAPSAACSSTETWFTQARTAALGQPEVLRDLTDGGDRGTGTRPRRRPELRRQRTRSPRLLRHGVHLMMDILVGHALVLALPLQR